MEFTHEEAAAILAGLRMVQEEVDLRWGGCDPFFREIYTNDGEFSGLTAGEINQLCERINTGE